MTSNKPGRAKDVHKRFHFFPRAAVWKCNNCAAMLGLGFRCIRPAKQLARTTARVSRAHRARTKFFAFGLGDVEVLIEDIHLGRHLF